MVLAFVLPPEVRTLDLLPLLRLLASVHSGDGHAIMSEAATTQADLDNRFPYPPSSKIEILEEDQHADHEQPKLSRWHRAADLCSHSVDILKFFDTSNVHQSWLRPEFHQRLRRTSSKSKDMINRSCTCSCVVLFEHLLR